MYFKQIVNEHHSAGCCSVPGFYRHADHRSLVLPSVTIESTDQDEQARGESEQAEA